MIEEARWLNSRVVFGALFASVALMPVVIWTSLVGAPIGGLAFTTILFIDFMLRGGGKRLSKQEIYLLSVVISIAAYSLFFMDFINRVYFSNSPEAKAFGVTEHLPRWWVPADPLIREQIVRSFLHPEWVLPIAVSLATVALGALMLIPLGYLAYMMYAEVERLPFPLAMVQVEIATTLGEREPRKLKAFVAGFLASFGYMLLAYTPLIMGAVVGGTPVTIIPIPFADWALLFERAGLYGVLLGLATDMFSFLSGFIIPPRFILSMFIGSIAIWVVGNNILLTHFRWLVPEWTPGLNIPSTWQWTFFNVWSSVLMGLGLALSLTQLIDFRKAFSRSFSILKSVRKPKAGALPLTWVIGLYLAGAIAWTLLVIYLLPGMPWIVPVLLVIVWPFLFTMIDAAAVAMTGVGLGGFPVRDIALLTTGGMYNIPVRSELGVGMWFAPIAPGAGTGWTTHFYICKQLGISIRDAILTIIAVATPLSLIMNFVHVSLIWSFGPIPSQNYPWALMSWPISVIQTCIWIERGARLHSLLLAGSPLPLLEISLVAGVVLYSAIKLLRLPLVPLLIGAGAGTLPPSALATVLGYIAYRLINKLTKRSFEEYKFALFAGAAVGQGIVFSLLVALAIIGRTPWLLPY